MEGEEIAAPAGEEDAEPGGCGHGSELSDRSGVSSTTSVPRS